MKKGKPESTKKAASKVTTEDELLSTIPEKKEDRLLIFGVHPMDIRDPKPVFCFWASKFLMQQYPCVGDLVNVGTKKSKGNDIRKTSLFVTDLKMWEPGDYEPTQIARRLYRGEKYADFEMDIED